MCGDLSDSQIASWPLEWNRACFHVKKIRFRQQYHLKNEIPDTNDRNFKNRIKKLGEQLIKSQEQTWPLVFNWSIFIDTDRLKVCCPASCWVSKCRYQGLSHSSFRYCFKVQDLWYGDLNYGRGDWAGPWEKKGPVPYTWNHGCKSFRTCKKI